ncbi:hypothetical protein BABINDRAFT_158932 [Babjeviella inositovora NRRL Y-12698]|uniref:Peroxisomal targeting signal receptor n=1 Tax=Babjeviella inositovora NRRL Y-12698 TaxID=984486 RepID=A0A1E3QXC4_9ASCO|nr:uncharacterized protein BABINDRAFT_158932 [Babjeviella inositovora NRRL Y-12698]ODQ82310.1 hypothetical protein BABINDRAFT_158932 [Babjeviella inositovora NRRL Y-12698]
MAMNAMDLAQMEQFSSMGGAALGNFAPMRHELNHIQAPTQNLQNAPMGASQWSSEFLAAPVAQNAWKAEFTPEQNVQNLQNQTPQQYGRNYNQMGMARPMMGMGMGMHMQHNMSQNQQNAGKIVELDDSAWDAEFQEAEQLSSQQEKPADLEEIVIDDKFQANFQDVWDNLNSEVFSNEFLNQQANEPSWEKDFAAYASTRANFGEYKFEKENQFAQMDDPYTIGMKLMESGAKLSEAALAFEAAIQQNERHVDAWLRLGEVQTQNEKELAGISALEKCLELDPKNLPALMTLAVSYINEGYDNAAFATLERWIETKYPLIAETARAANPKINDEDRYSLNKRVTELFIQAAQVSPDLASMDADVQMGLGVLFYANEDFDKTIDCFKAALQVSPDDALLWNRLGASLANSNRSEEAVDAYFRALELRPAFVRARYNLGVSCINIGCYKEAAQHLLGGLSMHAVEGVEANNDIKNQSTSLLETLKRSFIAMDRRDLLEKVKPNMDLDQFRGEFEF